MTILRRGVLPGCWIKEDDFFGRRKEMTFLHTTYTNVTHEVQARVGSEG